MGTNGLRNLKHKTIQVSLQNFGLHEMRNLFEPGIFQKVALLHWRFPRFLNWTNGTKSRNASHNIKKLTNFLEKYIENKIKKTILQ